MSHLANYSNQRVLDKYKVWDAANPEFYPMFVKFAQVLAQRGYRRLSAALIFERIRWERMTSTLVSADFAINDNFRAVYARRFMDDHPQYGDLFQLKSARP